MSTTAEPSTDSFSTVLRERTAPDHGAAEHSPLMAELVAGTLDRALLGEMLAQHLLVYRALEATGERLADDPVVAPFLLPGLARTAVLEDDVRRVCGPDALEHIVARPATAAYVSRLEEVATWPGGFVAHHYTRYLGDLSGGQFIGRVVARAYPDLGIGFYTFDDIESPKAVKDAYRRLLDEAPWTPEERDRIVDEVRLAYSLNQAMFADLEG